MLHPPGAAIAVPVPFSWSNWRRFYGDLWRVEGVRAVPEALFRAGLGLCWELSWALDRPAPPAEHPLVIIGHQRSGTTWLHRLLAAQPGATALPLHGLVFPADSAQRLFAALAPRPAWLDRLQERALAPMDPLHRIRLHEPEEDEFCGWVLFRSAMNAFDRPWPAAIWPDLAGDEVSMAVYAQAVAKAARRGGRYVGKNPHLSHRVPELRAALPGVRVVRLVRDPAEAIPSRLSLIRAIWRRRFAGFDELSPHHVERIYANSVRCYLAAEGQADLDVAYTDLVADPASTLARLHARFDLPAPAPIEQVGRAGRTPHRYSLEAFGLDEARLHRDLAPIYERWGF